MGTSQDYRVAVEEGATLRPGRLRSVRALNSGRGSGKRLEPGARLLRDRRGGEYWDDDFAAEQSLERSYADAARTSAGCTAAQRSAEFDDWSEPRTAPKRDRASAEPAAAGRSLEAVASASAKVHLVIPRSFNDAQSIADNFKDSVPVILNLQSADPELAKRLIDFSSGLTYALNGGMQRVADKVFLLTPRNVEVSAEERARLLERGFFNQA